MTGALDALRDALVDAASTLRWCTGFQAHAIHGDKTLLSIAFGVDGLGAPIDTTSIFPIYCAGKPITAIAIGQLVESKELSFDDRIGDVLDRILDPSIQGLTIDDLLTHCAGLWRYPAEQFLATSSLLRAERVCHLRGERQANGVGTYAEFAGWELLRLVIEEVAGVSFVEYVRSQILTPFGIDDDVFFRLSADRDRVSRLRINVDLEPGVPLPLLWERSSENLVDISAATGAFASMEGLATFYHRLLEVHAGRGSGVISAETVRGLTAPRTVLGHDPVLGRNCRHARGFMSDLRSHEFAEDFGIRSFGHSGLNGMTFGGADPDLNLAFAVHLNAVTAHVRGSEDPDVSSQARRRFVTNLLISATKESSGPAMQF